MDFSSQIKYLLKKTEIDGNSSVLLNFQEGLNIITAPNGSGKTTLWKIIRWTLGGHLKSHHEIDFINPTCKLSFDNNCSVTRKKGSITITDSGKYQKLSTAELHNKLFRTVLPNLEKLVWEDFLDFVLLSTEKNQMTKVLEHKFAKIALKSNSIRLEQVFDSDNNDYSSQLSELISSLLERSENLSNIDRTSLRSVLSTLLYFNLLKDTELKTLNLEIIDDLLEDLEVLRRFIKKTSASKRKLKEKFDFELIIDDIGIFLSNALKQRNQQEINQILKCFTINEEILSVGELISRNYIILAYIFSKLNIAFPLIIDEPFGRLDNRSRELVIEILSTLPQVIILCTKNTLPKIPSNLQINLMHFQNLFYETTQNLLEKFKLISKQYRWVLQEEYVQLGSQVYVPDFVINLNSKKILIEFKKEITTNIRLRLQEIITDNEELYEALIITPQTLLFGKFDQKLKRITTKEYPSHKIDSILSEIQQGGK